MSIVHEEERRDAVVLDVARLMMIAARTAPKARGIDNLEIALLDKEQLPQLATKMREMARQDEGRAFFARDAGNVEQANCVVVIGTRLKSIGLRSCGWCGFESCEIRNDNPETPCAFNTNDLGIAVGSAVSVAMENRVDSRVMFSVGKAAIEMNILGDQVKIVLGIPLSVSAKSPFFDRK